jgi:4-amino-4-deoxy-L-arabinose transferase-like glycosyltransferase
MLFREKGIYYEIAVVLLLVLFLGSTSLIYPFGRDQGEYAYIASAWLQGKVIYKEVFNVKPPLTHLLHVLALKLFGHSMVAIRLFDLLWQCATAVVILLISNLLYNKNRIGVLSAALYGFYYYSVNYWHIAQTDGFITLPLSLSVLMFLIAREKNKPFLWISSGMFLGISVLLKYPIGILLVFLLLIMLFSQKKPIKLEYINILYLSAGFILPVFIFILSLFANNALHGFLYIQLNFIKKYNIGNRSDTSNLVLMINNLIGNYIRALYYARYFIYPGRKNRLIHS